MSKKWYHSTLWRKLRQLQLLKEPLCSRCGEIATVVNHKTPHRGRWELFNNAENLESVCEHCHNAVIQRQEKYGYDKAVNQDGWPTDENHPFNKIEE